MPAQAAATKALDKGWLVNIWFRLKHPDYDQLLKLMTLLGEVVRVHAQ